MQNHKKRELILDAMQDLMNTTPTQTITVSDIAKKAGIGKGSIYYYFHSKNDILEAVIERSYSAAIEESKRLVRSSHIDVFTKMEILFHTCLDASSELKRQEEIGSFIEIQQSALIHQKFIQIIIKNLKPFLADIICQGISDGSIQCQYPEEMSEIILIVLTFKLDNHILPSTKQEIRQILTAFSVLQSKGMAIDIGKLRFLTTQEADADAQLD